MIFILFILLLCSNNVYILLKRIYCFSNVVRSNFRGKSNIRRKTSPKRISDDNKYSNINIICLCVTIIIIILNIVCTHKRKNKYIYDLYKPCIIAICFNDRGRIS